MSDFITSDPKFTISLVLTIFSIILAYYFYYRSLNIKLPCYNRRSRLLINPTLTAQNPIKVTFNKKAVNTLSLAYIAFWNNGRATINRDDIAGTDPLRIVSSKDCRILAADIAVANRAVNNFKVTLLQESNVITIDFDFIDHKNGAVIRIYHTGVDHQDIDLIGTIKGTSGILNVGKSEETFITRQKKFQNEVSTRLFGSTPRRWIKYMVQPSNTIQGFILSVIVSIPVAIIALPFLLILIVGSMILFLLSMLSWLLNMWRYSMPEELDSVFTW